MKIDQKRIVITGASSGIGRALLQELSEHQVQIVAVGRDEMRLRDVRVCRWIAGQGHVLPLRPVAAKGQGKKASQGESDHG